MSKAAVGGLAKGPSHAEGGIPKVVQSTGRHIELEGDEYVFKKGSLTSDEILELEGTPWDIIKQIAKKYNSSLGKLEEINGGEFVVCKKVLYDTEKIKVKGTAQEIVDQLQAEKGCKQSCTHEFKTGGQIDNCDPFETLFFMKLNF